MIGTGQGETEVPPDLRDEDPPGCRSRLFAACDRWARLTVEQRSQSSIGWGKGVEEPFSYLGKSGKIPAWAEPAEWTWAGRFTTL